MSDAFELVEPHDAQDFLEGFDANTRRKGESYFRSGRVRDIVPETPGILYSVHVQGTELYQVTLLHSDVEGWTGSCTCPLEFECKHVYAAMKALLAEHSVAAVRGLSSGKGRKAPQVAGGDDVVAGQYSGGVLERVQKTLKRPLKAEETRFLTKLGEVYQRSCQTRHITNWDFQDLGLPLGGYGWNAIQIWPSFPESEYEFWLYVANAVSQRGLAIPKFLEPVTDLTEVQDRLLRWQRGQEVERWKNVLHTVATSGSGLGAINRGAFDIRLAITETAAELEWKRPGQEGFTRFKGPQFRQFMDDHRDGRLEIPPEAELICQVFETRFVYGSGSQLAYQDSTARPALGRLLRLPAVADRVVNDRGEIMPRAAGALRWELTPATDASGDYRFRLVQENGEPVPAILCMIAGHPALYLTRNAIFSGPPLMDGALNPAKDNVIPAPAIESRAGLEFLQAMRLDLPARLRERVREVALQVAIRCSLGAPYAGATVEHCIVQVSASSPDGAHQETWNGDAWIDVSPEPRKGQVRDSGQTITVFDRTVLQEVARLLEPLGLKRDYYTNQLAVRVTKKFPEVFAPWLKSLPPQVEVKLEGELASFADDIVSGRVRLDVTEAAIDWFDLHVVLDVSDTTLTPAEIKLLLNAKGGYVRLGTKGWKRLQFDLTEEEDERLAKLGLNPHALSSEPQRLHALQLADDSAKSFLPEQQVEQIQRRVGEIKARVTPDVPASVTAELRPYQREGFHFLAYLAANRFGGILADDMGLGKTLQTLAWLVWLRDQAAPEAAKSLPSIVVCPKSVMDNWHAEAGRFTTGLRVKSWAASELEGFVNRLGEADLHVLNYSQLRLLGETLVQVQWLAVILDEGQYIKNPSSQTAQVARALRAQHRLVLSGTPIENRLLDLWSLMAFAMPGVLGSRAKFGQLFDSKEDPFARRRLAARVRPFLLRRTKSQVAKDLPDRTEEDLFCEIEGEQKVLYRAELKRAQQMLLKIQTQKQLAKERFHFLTSLLRLRQVCCHPALVRPESKAPSAKVEALLEQLEPIMEEGQKVLVFSQFVEMLALLKPALSERNWPMFYLAGETENRGDLVREFQATEGAAVFLISLKAGGFGLNLTAASYVVLFDPWWNPAVENQAIDRTHRIGQVNKVIAYRLLIKDSIEEKIRALQKQKKALAEDVLGEEKFAQSLTLEDLQFLFAD